MITSIVHNVPLEFLGEEYTIDVKLEHYINELEEMEVSTARIEHVMGVKNGEPVSLSENLNHLISEFALKFINSVDVSNKTYEELIEMLGDE